MKIAGKQLADTLRTESTPFDIVYADRVIGDLNGAIRFTAVNDEVSGGGDSIGAYSVVYIKGQSGNLPTIGLANATTTAMPAFGLTVSSSDYQDEVDVITFGNLKGVDTSLLDVGSVLYVSTVSGEYTTTPPTGTSSKIQNIGMVVKSDSNGIIKVGGAGRSNATPNLDEGHFFLGNSSNESVSSGYTLPTSVGTSGQVLTSNGTNVIFGDLDTGSLTVESKTANFTASENYFYLVDTTSGSNITVNLPSPSSVGQRIKIFNHGDGTLTLNDPGTQVGIDPYTDSVPIIYQSSRVVNSRALVELVSTSSTLWEYVIIPQLELDESALTTTGQIFAYNADELAMKALPYTLPTTTGNTDQILKLNSSGGLIFSDESTLPQYTLQTSSTNFSPHTYYIIPPGTSKIGLTMPLANNANASSYNNLYFEVINYSSNVPFLYWDNVNISNDYYVSVFDSTGEISPYTGNYTYDLSTYTKIGVIMQYTYNSGLQNHYLNYYIINMA